MKWTRVKNVCKELGSGLGCIPLLSQNMWFKFRGFNEKWIHWGWHEEELTLRVTQEYPWKNLSFRSSCNCIEEPLSNDDIKQIENKHETPLI